MNSLHSQMIENERLFEEESRLVEVAHQYSADRVVSCYQQKDAEAVAAQCRAIAAAGGSPIE